MIRRRIKRDHRLLDAATVAVNRFIRDEGKKGMKKGQHIKASPETLERLKNAGMVAAGIGGAALAGFGGYKAAKFLKNRKLESELAKLPVVGAAKKAFKRPTLKFARKEGPRAINPGKKLSASKVGNRGIVRNLGTNTAAKGFQKEAMPIWKEARKAGNKQLARPTGRVARKQGRKIVNKLMAKQPTKIDRNPFAYRRRMKRIHDAAIRNLRRQRVFNDSFLQSKYIHRLVDNAVRRALRDEGKKGMKKGQHIKASPETLERLKAAGIMGGVGATIGAVQGAIKHGNEGFRLTEGSKYTPKGFKAGLKGAAFHGLGNAAIMGGAGYLGAAAGQKFRKMFNKKGAKNA